MNSEPEDRVACHHLQLHVRVRDREHDVDLAVPSGPRRLVELLPVARDLSEHLTAAMLDIERAEGRSPSCRAGCGSCCRQLVAISFVEAQGLAELVARLPAERQALIRGRFAESIRRLEAAGLLDPTEARGSRHLAGRNLGSAEASVRDLGRRYFALQVGCPFLDDEACGIYAERPSVCREHLVTSPAERCATVYESDVRSVPTPQRVGDLLMHAAHDVCGLPLGKLPLILSLEWAEVHGHRLETKHDGLALFQAMLGQPPTE